MISKIAPAAAICITGTAALSDVRKRISESVNGLFERAEQHFDALREQQRFQSSIQVAKVDPTQEKFTYSEVFGQTAKPVFGRVPHRIFYAGSVEGGVSAEAKKMIDEGKFRDCGSYAIAHTNTPCHWITLFFFKELIADYQMGKTFEGTPYADVKIYDQGKVVGTLGDHPQEVAELLHEGRFFHPTDSQLKINLNTHTKA